jgi:hypothetical protein
MCTPLPKAHYSKIKGNLFHATICFLGLNQHNDTVPNGSLLDLVFTNISDLNISISNFSMVSSDKYHPPLLLDFHLMLDYSYLLSTPRRLYGRGDYLLLYNTLFRSDWPCVYNEKSVNSAVLNLTAIVAEAINQANPFVKYRKSSLPHWFYSNLKHYIKNKNQYFTRYKKSNLQNTTLVSHSIEN